MNNARTNSLLGYPDDARLLIINADDFGMCHAINEATLRALTEGVVSSTSLMAPCPWAAHAMQLLREHPHIPFGVHLTVVCDFAGYRWGQLTSNDRVPSLVDNTGYFFNNAQIPALLAQVKPDELKVEFRAQIETVLSAGLMPTHLDWHCLADGGRTDIFDMSVGLAREYGLAVRVHDGAYATEVQRSSLPANDHGVLDSYILDPAGKAARYTQLLRELPPGLSEWAVHPSLGNAEAQAMEPESWQVRKTDFDFVTSADARRIIEEEGIILLDYRPLQEAWRRVS